MTRREMNAQMCGGTFFFFFNFYCVNQTADELKKDERCVCEREKREGERGEGRGGRTARRAKRLTYFESGLYLCACLRLWGAD